MSESDRRHEREFNNEKPDWYQPANSEGISRDVVVAQTQLHELALALHRPKDSDFSQPGYRKTHDGANRRQFMRCKLTGEQTQGSLFVNGKCFACRLMEMSIGGFGILVAGNPEFAAGTSASLRAPNLSYVVQIARVENREGSCFLGLKQIEEVLDHSQRLPGEPVVEPGYTLAIVSGLLISVLAYGVMTLL